MGRSVKKGPFVSESLIKKVIEMNKKGEKRVLKPGQERPRYFRKW